MYARKKNNTRKTGKAHIPTIIIIYHFSAIFDINKNDFSLLLLVFPGLYFQELVVMLLFFSETILK